VNDGSSGGAAAGAGDVASRACSLDVCLAADESMASSDHIAGRRQGVALRVARGSLCVCPGEASGNDQGEACRLGFGSLRPEASHALRIGIDFFHQNLYF